MNQLSRQVEITLLPSGAHGVVYGILQRTTEGKRSVRRLIRRGYLEGGPLQTDVRDLGKLLAELAHQLRNA